MANNGVCPLCRHNQESGVHLFQDYRYTRRVWEGIAMWLGNEHLRPSAWVLRDSVQTWWEDLDRTPSTARRGLRSIIILVCWEVWNERNARIFERKEYNPHQCISSIRSMKRLARGQWREQSISPIYYCACDLRLPEVGRVGLLSSCAQLYMFVQCLSILGSLLFNTIGSSPAGSV
jgi:hypothetical protein